MFIIDYTFWNTCCILLYRSTTNLI